MAPTQGRPVAGLTSFRWTQGTSTASTLSPGVIGIDSELEISDVDAAAKIRERVDHSRVGGDHLKILALREGNIQGVVEAPTRQHSDIKGLIRQVRGRYEVDGYSTEGA